MGGSQIVTLHYRRWIALYFNQMFRGKWQSFVAILPVVVTVDLLQSIIFPDLLIVLIFSVFILFLFSMSLVRLNHAFIYHRWFHVFGMSIDNFSPYYQWNYILQKEELKNQFQEDFIEALEILHRRGFHSVKMTTHTWGYYKVIQNERVTSLFQVDLLKKGTGKIPMEVILLIKPSLLAKKTEAIVQEINKPRTLFRLKLKKIPNNQ